MRDFTKNSNFYETCVQHNDIETSLLDQINFQPDQKIKNIIKSSIIF